MAKKKTQTSKKKACPFCEGTGLLVEECLNCMGFRCLECDGQGYTVRDCEYCGGTGIASKPLSNPDFQKNHGHYCRICGRRRANEKFSKNGRISHICKDCAREKRAKERLARKQQDQPKPPDSPQESGE